MWLILLKHLTSFKRRKLKKGSYFSRFLKIISLCSIFILSLMLVFFISDDFMIYMQLLVLPREEARQTDFYINEEENQIYSSSGAFTAGGSTDRGGSFSGAVMNGGADYLLGEVGVPLILANKMSEGYLRDWIEIMERHLTYEMWPHDAISPPMRNGEPWSPTIMMAFGTTFAETGLSNGYIPSSVLVLGKYNSVDHYNLYEANSQLLRELGNDYVNPTYGMDMVYGSYLTPFQFSRAMISLTPEGPADATNKLAQGEATCWPSRMNGYKIDAGTLRDNFQNDAAYFPDQVCTMIQSECSRLQEGVNLNEVNPYVAEALGYAVHNGGTGVLINTWALGGRPGTDYKSATPNYLFGVDFPWTKGNPNGTLTKKEVATCAANNLVPYLEKCLNYLMTADKPEKEMNLTDHSNYEGMQVMSFLAGGKGFIASETALSRLKGKLGHKGWMNGALVGYKAITGRYQATMDEVINFINNMKVTPVDTSLYGPVYTGKTGDYAEIVVHMYCDSYQVYNGEGAGPMPALHAYNTESTRGVFSCYIVGSYAYWKALLACGVECETWQEAMADAKGRKLSWVRKPGQDVTALQPLEPGSVTSRITDSYFSDNSIGLFTENAMDYTCNSPMYNRAIATNQDGGSVGIHGGEDYPLRWVQLLACGNGVVARSDYNEGGYGNRIIISLDKKSEDEPQVSILYGHLKERQVKDGERVNAGEVIGISGNTGASSGPHLHIEIRVERAGKEVRVPYGSVAMKKYFTVQYAPAAYYTKKKNPCPVYGADGNLLVAINNTGEWAKANGFTDLSQLSLNDAPDDRNYETTGIGLWFDAARELERRIKAAGYG